jgi:Flp pilus assembly protein TadD
VALESLHGPGRAIEVLQQAHSVHPADQEILSTLVAYNAKIGDRQAAIGWARRLVREYPHDSRWKDMLDRIEGRRPKR